MLLFVVPNWGRAPFEGIAGLAFGTLSLFQPPMLICSCHLSLKNILWHSVCVGGGGKMIAWYIVFTKYLVSRFAKQQTFLQGVTPPQAKTNTTPGAKPLRKQDHSPE